MKYLKKFESFKINEGMTEDLVESLYKELTELKNEKGHFSEADYNDLMSKRGLEEGMKVEIFNKLKDKGFVFEEDLKALFNELTKLKNEKGYFSEADYNDLMSKRGLEEGMKVEIFNKLKDKGFVFEEDLKALFNELTKLKNEKGYFSVDDYYNLMDDKNLSRVAEDTFHKLVGMGFGFEDEPEEDDDDIILPSYNLN